jgi:hypothetical protein
MIAGSSFKKQSSILLLDATNICHSNGCASTGDLFHDAEIIVEEDQTKPCVARC